LAGQTVAAMKSGVSRVNSCTVSRPPMGRSIVLFLSANVTSVLINVAEIEIFCRRYLKISDSSVNEYVLTKFCGAFRDTFRILCT